MRRSNTHRHRQLLRHEKRLSRSGYKLVAGIDEAGRGPLAGPVVASAVILQDHRFFARIDDSKKLSEKRREEAYLEIVERAIIGIGIVDEKTIDEVNIYRATLRAMEIAVANLETPPDYVIIDGNMKPSIGYPFESIIKGDSKSLSIAAASIVAKVTRDRIMKRYHDLYPQYGYSSHKGYATFRHKEALRKHGPSPIHRLSFSPTVARRVSI